jgi:hypothetical protein
MYEILVVALLLCAVVFCDAKEGAACELKLLAIVAIMQAFRAVDF